MDERKLYRLCADEFAARARRLGDRWDAPTPCAGWDVCALVRHVVEEELWVPPLLAGATIGDVGDRFTGDQLGDNALGAFERAHAAALTAVDEAPDRAVHLSFGDTPRAEYTLQLAADHLVHAWDLARAMGEDDTLDAGAVEAVREWFGSMEDAYRGAGVIGDRVPVDPGADPQTALLAMFGRTRSSGVRSRMCTPAGWAAPRSSSSRGHSSPATCSRWSRAGSRSTTRPGAAGSGSGVPSPCVSASRSSTRGRCRA